MQPSPNDLKNAAQDAGNYVGDKAKQLAKTAEGTIDRASDKMKKGEGKSSDLYEQAGEVYETARDRAVDAFDTSSDFVKKYPLYTVAGAVAVGFVAAMILRRRN
jgi:ElaB/YqjD/DUF883 family membrane-anchored ribosome-binding protein